MYVLKIHAIKARHHWNLMKSRCLTSWSVGQEIISASQKHATQDPIIKRYEDRKLIDSTMKASAHSYAQ